MANDCRCGGVLCEYLSQQITSNCHPVKSEYRYVPGQVSKIASSSPKMPPNLPLSEADRCQP